MEILSIEFLYALLAIVVIDLVLAGDNAIVIALAARSLPPHLKKRAIVWGAVGAIAVRSAMTLIVVWLLKIPGLLLVGGALLIWIAYRLLLPENDEGEGDKVTTEWPNGYSCIAEKRAMETIQNGQPSTAFMQYGDTIRIEMKGADGLSVFGAIEQEVVALEKLRP